MTGLSSRLIRRCLGSLRTCRSTVSDTDEQFFADRFYEGAYLFALIQGAHGAGRSASRPGASKVAGSGRSAVSHGPGRAAVVPCYCFSPTRSVPGGTAWNRAIGS